jgi:adenylate cyclase
LSKLSQLFVIARNSSFSFQGKNVQVQEIGKTLGARYVLEGSVRKVEKRVRIAAQLIDAANDGHLWAERSIGI